jgi:eukaryotic-like serine/threonine-protein kinase
VTIQVPIPQGLLASSALVAGRYRLDKVLGMGGMGYVVSAVHVGPDRQVERVAIKFMLPDALHSSSLHRRFVREAEAIGRLRSEHVCRLLDTGRTPDGAPYMVMEYLSGHDLERLVSGRGPLPLHEAADYGLQILDAMAEAHSQGIIHRDLKPANVFRAWGPDDTPIIKVLDFGVAKAADGMQSTATNTVMGSPSFMAPEQIVSSKRVDERADIYSIGAVLYFLLTGKPPFDAEQLPALCLKVLNEDPVPPSHLRPDLPPEIDDIILTCMARDQCNRFPNVAELAHALAPFAPEGARPLAQAAARALAWTPGVWEPSLARTGAATVSERRPELAGDGFATQLVRGAPDGSSIERVGSRRRRVWLAAVAACVSVAAGVGTVATLASSSDHTGRASARPAAPSPRPAAGAPARPGAAIPAPATAASPSAASPATAASPSAASPTTAASPSAPSPATAASPSAASPATAASPSAASPATAASPSAASPATSASPSAASPTTAASPSAASPATAASPSAASPTTAASPSAASPTALESASDVDVESEPHARRRPRKAKRPAAHSARPRPRSRAEAPATGARARSAPATEAPAPPKEVDKRPPCSLDDPLCAFGTAR